MSATIKEKRNAKFEKLKALLYENGQYKTLTELGLLLNMGENAESRFSNFNRRGISGAAIKHIEEHFAPDGFLETDIHILYRNITGKDLPDDTAWERFNTSEGQAKLQYLMYKELQRNNDLLEQLINNKTNQ